MNILKNINIVNLHLIGNFKKSCYSPGWEYQRRANSKCI